MKTFKTGLMMTVLMATLVAAHAQTDATKGNAHRLRYKVVDLGTFGGPNSYYFLPFGPSVSRSGAVVGGADTTEPDPDYPSCFGNACLTVHAFRWRHGKLKDLGTLPNGANSGAIYINDSGLIAGFGDDGLVDPFTGTPDLVPLAWQRGKIIEIGTFGGSFGFPNAINNRGEIIGVALNDVPDDFSMLGSGPTETRAFLWRDGSLKDLGTLGGPDAWAAYTNEQGQIAGWSYTDSAPNPTTGVPTQHPYLWDKGRMRDLGTLGGTLAVVGSFASPGGGALNNRGQVAGTSNLTGDVNWHPFLWSQGRMVDLGTLGGANGEAYWINDSGDVVGRADIPGSTNHHAFLWRKGKMLDLGAAPGWPCSTAEVINARGEVIIDTGICGVGGGPGYLWRDGVSYELNTLVPADTPFFIGDLFFINDRGEIAAVGVLPNGNIHDLLLTPCGGRDHDGECSDDDRARASVSPVIAASTAARAAASAQARYLLTARAAAAVWRARPAPRLGTPNAPTH
jgi:probable HAF family extracellular repeat protein